MPRGGACRGVAAAGAGRGARRRVAFAAGRRPGRQLRGAQPLHQRLRIAPGELHGGLPGALVGAAVGLRVPRRLRPELPELQLRLLAAAARTAGGLPDGLRHPAQRVRAKLHPDGAPQQLQRPVRLFLRQPLPAVPVAG
jgi:hypothetical protein